MLAQRSSTVTAGNVSGSPGARWDAAIRAGDFPAAWAVSDAVLAARDPATRDDPSQPYHLRWVWDGRPLAGRRVLVRCYHGLGDTLQFCRYLAPLRARAAHLTLEVQPELAGLLATMADAVHPFDPARPLPPAEADIEIMELAHALRLPPTDSAYLVAPPSPLDAGRVAGRVALGAGRVALGAGRVGLCWQAGGWDPARDMPPSALAPLLSLPLLGLQRGPAATALRLPDPLSGSMDLGAVASLVAGLDAVVTVDTMIAHLAGALGRPTVVMLKHRADWRWGEGDRCAWYGSARLIRQCSPGCWDGVADRALLAVRQAVRPGSPQRATNGNFHRASR